MRFATGSVRMSRFSTARSSGYSTPSWWTLLASRSGGFSDGATYAVSLGLINGDLFRRVAAFSPGFVVNSRARGKPRVFLSHGTNDDILPIDRCGRVVAAGLRKRGYDVTFREFNGGHEVPAAIATEAMAWLAAF
jgi:phospholipase/carboxylesterase